MNRIHFEDLSPETIDGVDKVVSILEGIEGLELHRYRIYNQEYEHFFNFYICLKEENKISVNIPMADLFEIEQKSDNVERDVVIYILDLLVRKLVEANIALEESEDNRVKTELDRVETELEDCEDYISREQALKALGEAPYVWKDSDAELQAYEDWRTIKEMLEGLPSIAPKKPKTGHWIDTKEMVTDIKGHILHEVICPECSGISYFRGMGGKYIGANICPNCGAKMESEE